MNTRINEIFFILLMCCFINGCGKKKEIVIEKDKKLFIFINDKPYSYEDFEIAEL